jgi:hypothetical protein
MEYVTKINIFGLKIMVKSGLENNIFEIPPCAKPFLKKPFLLHRKVDFYTKVQIKY